MTDTHILGDRRKALEEAFFAKKNRELLENMRAQREAEMAREDLAAASGIHDEAVLDHLQGLGLDRETVAALALVPLVEVAWADDRLETKEHQAVLKAAEESGVAPGSPAHQLLDSWLEERPDGELMEVWLEYTRALVEPMEEAQRKALRDGLLSRARTVAEAAGGFLGLGSRVSRPEQDVLDRLAQPFVDP